MNLNDIQSALERTDIFTLIFHANCPFAVLIVCSLRYTVF